jgi:hypothetical protein
MDISNATGCAFMIRYRSETLELPSRILCKVRRTRHRRGAIRPPLSGRISAPKGQEMVKRRVQIELISVLPDRFLFGDTIDVSDVLFGHNSLYLNAKQEPT